MKIYMHRQNHTTCKIYIFQTRFYEPFYFKNVNFIYEQFIGGMVLCMYLYQLDFYKCEKVGNKMA